MTRSTTAFKTAPLTHKQIDAWLNLLCDALHKSGLPSEQTQQVLASHGGALADEFVGSVRRHVEAISNLIVRHVTVNRDLTPQEVLDATGRKQYTDRNVVKGMPRGEGEEVTVCFFTLCRNLSPAMVEEAYELRGLTPDPIAQAKVNTDDPSFADEHPNGTQWQDAQGRWCFAAFRRGDDGRVVSVHRVGDDWDVPWCFGGVRK